MVNVGLICGRKAARAVAQCVGSRSDSFWHETADTRERPYGRSGEFAKVMEAGPRASCAVIPNPPTWFRSTPFANGNLSERVAFGLA